MDCFVIRGFGEKKDSGGTLIDFDRVDRELIRPAMAQCGLSGGTTTVVQGAGPIHQDMFELILLATVVICDITVHNPNVFYELGVRHALRKKHTVLIKGSPSNDQAPFDIAGLRYMEYAWSDPRKDVQKLVDTIRATQALDRETDSPIFLMMPKLLPTAAASRPCRRVSRRKCSWRAPARTRGGCGCWPAKWRASSSSATGFASWVALSGR